MSGKKLKIVLFGDPVLREKAKPVTVFHNKLLAQVDSIGITLDNRDDGAALAANQVAILKRITVIDYEDEYLEMLNPEILDSSGEQTGYEGCLSLPGFVGMVRRAEYVKVKYTDPLGKDIIIERTGKMARCIQHEIDHLDGILFVDRMVEDYLIHSETEARIERSLILDIINGKVPIKDLEPHKVRIPEISE